MLFSNVVGQSEAKNHLLKMVQTNRLPHALMILGNDGFGGLPLALALAQYVNCENPSAEDSCGKCASCLQNAKVAHPDVHFTVPTITPKPGAKNVTENFITEVKEFIKQLPYGSVFDWLKYIQVKNKQGNISADECRKIIEQLNLKSYQGKKKIQIIWRPEFLGKEGNILLKLIEEPTDDTLLIFVAENEEQILQTIISRVQQLKLKPISIDDIQTSLLAHHKIDESKSLQIAQLAEGNYQNALQLIQHWDNDLLPIVKDYLNAVFTNNGTAILKWVDEVSKLGREPQKHLLKYMEKLFGLALHKRVAPNIPTQLPESDEAIVTKIAQLQLAPEAYERFIKLFNQSNYHIARNANVSVQLLNLCIQSQYALKDRTLEV